jgi:hypothetical protein
MVSRLRFGTRCGAKGGRMVRLLYLVMSLAPTVAVVALAWYVVRSVSVRIVWREPERHPLDEGPTASS